MLKHVAVSQGEAAVLTSASSHAALGGDVALVGGSALDWCAAGFAGEGRVDELPMLGGFRARGEDEIAYGR